MSHSASEPDSTSWQEWETLLQLRDHSELIAATEQTGLTEFQLQQQLRKDYPDAVVRAALILRDCRRRAVDKYAAADRLWFDRTGLEQATHEAVAHHKAQRFDGQIWDLCTGIGADAAALARRGRVITVDRNPANCQRAQWNAEVWNVDPLICCGDVHTIDIAGKLVHIDPDRRATGPSRSVRIEDYLPGLEYLQSLTQTARGGAIKLSPASNFGGKFSDVEIELTSWKGECKEATIWFGELAGEAAFRATVLPSGASLSGDPLDEITDVTPPGTFLYDPDPSVVRAGLVDRLGREVAMTRLDASEEYLTSSTLIESPFTQAFEILEILPNQSRAIRDYFRKSNVGQLEIKCRHVPTQVEAWRKQLTLPGDQPGVLIFARLEGKTKAVIARRV